VEVDQMMSNGLLFYGLQVRTTGTTEGILAFVDGRAGGAAYHPAEASWFPTEWLQWPRMVVPSAFASTLPSAPARHTDLVISNCWIFVLAAMASLIDLML
jgi:hypothetical protein